MKKIIFKKAIDILKMLDEKQIEYLWKKYTKNLKIVYSDKEEKLDCLSSLMLENNLEKLLFCDDEMLDFFEILEFEIINVNISKYVKEDYIFEIKNNYYIPLEYKDPSYMGDYDDTDDFDELLVQYYLLINGCIKLNKLVDIIRKTGLDITKQRVIEICNYLKFEIKNNIVYFNDFAKFLNSNNFLINIKNKHEYYVADIDNIYEYFEYILDMGELEGIDKYFINIKDENLVSCIKKDLFMITLFNNNLQLMIKDYLKTEIISEKQLNGIIKYLEELAQDTPCWILNGYSRSDVDYEFDIEDFSKTYNNGDFDEVSMYIFDYVAINGVITVDKIYDLILNVHKFNTNKKEIDKHIKILANNENILKIDNYLAIMPGTKISLREFYKIKHIQEYKIIDNLKNVEWGNLELHLKVEQLCEKYEFNDKLEQIILFITQVDVFSKEKFEDLLSLEKIIIPHWVKNKVISELTKINKNARLWSYNGFTIEELKSKKIPLK